MMVPAAAAAVHVSIDIDAEENKSTMAYVLDDDGDKTDTRHKAILNLERQGAASYTAAAALRAEQETDNA